ncbi:hypothetical protein CSPX01_04362 [Colletotrichum filicis]|nr:hypothetical protein CSPX01_04362 [Colletotrichum filicis]
MSTRKKPSARLGDNCRLRRCPPDLAGQHGFS